MKLNKYSLKFLQQLLFITCLLLICYKAQSQGCIQITCPGNIVIDCAASTNPSNTGTATASDDCSGVQSITSTDVNSPGTCAGNHVMMYDNVNTPNSVFTR